MNKLIFFGMVLVLIGLVVVQYSINTQAPAPAANAENTSGNPPPVSADPQMQKAYSKAQKSLDYFLSVADEPPPETKGFSVKVGVQDKGETEYFWVYPFNREEEGFSGRINNEPQLVDSVFNGEVINFERDQIVDWTFEDTATNIMHGNYTGCVLLEREAPENAQQFQELYGLNCDK